ncbi:MAG: 23S rRNA (pseudouridine(1915)-N(3))-methyltransferase RlmH, partial [Candidatus Woesearchaeota archaeon]
CGAFFMVQIKIIAVGRVKDNRISELIAEFLKRLKPLCNVTIVELKDEGLEKEGLRISKLIDSSAYILAEEGKMLDSVEFSKLMKEEKLTFILGGHDGIDAVVKKKGKLISLSRMTFTHEMSRLFLVEQIYRAMMIVNHREYYHK